MSKIADLESRRRSLQDIESILTAMKNLSLVELTKISRFYTTQQELFRTVESALADFQKFYGRAIGVTPANSLYILMGSERGFCGGFNEAIQRELEHQAAGTRPKLILVGRKLALRFLDDDRVVASLEGPSAAEEVPLIISRLARVLSGFPGSVWKIIHNRYSNKGSSVEVSCPFEFSENSAMPSYPFPPLLNLPSAELRPQLFEQYLFALFCGIFYLSFMAENHERLRHMDGALNKLADEEQRLRQASNSLRQENITEELEVIMLSVDDASQVSAGRSAETHDLQRTNSAKTIQPGRNRLANA
jgi:F-type H+-transporting ATPase subunit gamma